MIGATLTTRLAQYGINLLPLYRAVASSARGSHRNFFAYIFACESSPLPALRILAVARLEEKWKVRPYLD
jgi:hypothetical protein